MGRCETGRDSGELAARGLYRHPAPEAEDGYWSPRPDVTRSRYCRLGDPDVGIPREMDAARHHADNGVGGMAEVEAQSAREWRSVEDAVPEGEADDGGLQIAAVRSVAEAAAEHWLHSEHVEEIRRRRDGKMVLDDRPGLHRRLEIGEGGDCVVRVHLVANGAEALVARQRLLGVATDEPRRDDALRLGVRDVGMYDGVGEREHRCVERERKA